MNVVAHNITAYRRHLIASGRSAGTVRIYTNYLERFAHVVDDEDGLTLAACERFLARRDWKPETRKSARSVLRSFLTWAYKLGEINEDLARDLPVVSVPAGVARPAPDRVVVEAIATAEPRVRLMLMFAAYAGLRACEIARIHSHDWDGEFLHVVGKGGKTRVVPIVSTRLRFELNRLNGYMFPTPVSVHITPGHVTKLCSRALPPGYTLHMLRHRFATVAYDGTRDLLAVSRLLGHARPETTQRYVQLPTDAIRAACVAAAGPERVA